VRGLEFHIVSLLGEVRGEGVKAVLEKQATVDSEPYEYASAKIAAVAQAFSLPSRSLSQRMGSCDRVIALEALVAPWEPLS